jgi:DNA topoisomerase-2
MESIESRYKKLTPIEHILKRPGMYIGNITSEPVDMFVLDDATNIKGNNFILKEVNYNAGFLKIFDEILTNASDHAIRCKDNKWKPVTHIKVTVQKDRVIVENSGPGIPIQIHKEHKIYIPELVFGNIHSGENFDDDEERMVGGTHGLGASLTNIFSSKFIIETADGKKKYRQSFTNNLLKKNKPSISASNRNYTRITYFPDFEKFGLTEITTEIESIFIRRVIDVAAYSTSVKVYYNSKLIPIRTFKDYIKMFGEEIVSEDINDRWQIGVAKTQIDNFQQVSMVNGVGTIHGGTHVNFVTNAIIKTLTEKLNRSHKGLNIKPNFIKNHLFIFVNCKIPNPSFENQTKERLMTRLTAEMVKNFDISDNFYKKIIASELKNEIVNFIALKEFQEAKKETGQNSRKSKLKIKKLDDANKAGTSESSKCYLFLTEGDSAAATTKRGFSVTGGNYYGLYPLRGKPLNVKKVSLHKMMDDDEITHIISALGLEIGKKYNSTRTLRYGKVVIMTDQDHDGAHIKGLIINLFETYWPELLKLEFIFEFITPIVKVKKSGKSKYFYSLNDYNKWKSSVGSGWFIKYYKGLGTIEPTEAKNFFKDINKHLIIFNSEDFKQEREYIDLIFNKKRTDDRKEWLLKYIPGVERDKFNSKQTYKSFFDNEYKEYSIADNIRSIPSIVDGLKPSQRKILYTLFKRNFKNEVKVELLLGSILELSAYHHGPVSLYETIVGMAQDFTGANNINLLEPTGEFGTRLKGGKDASASRYIFTNLEKITKVIFNKLDDDVLENLIDDGYTIEPKHYMPILPMVLVNGSDGIGTGWSSFIPKFNPIDIIKYLENKIKKKKKNIEFLPWYNRFKGSISFDKENNKCISKGKVKIFINNRIKDTIYQVTELPVGVWNDKYCLMLDKLIKDEVIIDYDDDSTDSDIDIKIRVTKKLPNLYDVLHLQNSLSLNNMILFNEQGKIQKYASQYEIIDEFFDIRLEYYRLRKENILKVLEEQKSYLSNKMKFIQSVLKKNIVVENKKRDAIEAQIVKLKIVKWNDSYDYLLNIPLIQFSKEKLIEMQETFNKKKEDIATIKSTSIEKMWSEDLSTLKKML